MINMYCRHKHSSNIHTHHPPASPYIYIHVKCMCLVLYVHVGRRTANGIKNSRKNTYIWVSEADERNCWLQSWNNVQWRCWSIKSFNSSLHWNAYEIERTRDDDEQRRTAAASSKREIKRQTYKVKRGGGGELDTQKEFNTNETEKWISFLAYLC